MNKQINLEMPGGRYTFVPAKGVTEEQMADFKKMNEEFEAAQNGEEVPEQPKADAKEPAKEKVDQEKPVQEKVPDIDTFGSNLSTDVNNLVADLREANALIKRYKELEQEVNALRAKTAELETELKAVPAQSEDPEALKAEIERLKTANTKLKKQLKALVDIGDDE